MSGRPHYEHGNSSITGNTTPSSNELPPLSHSSRSASFSNLLNPASQDDGSQRRRKAADMDSPPTSARPLTISKQRQGPEAPQSSADIQHRRILTPRSPSLHRATSMGQLGPAGTIDAQQTPFLNSPRARTYTAEPGLAGVPALPTPKAYPPLPSPPTLDRKPSTNTTSDSRARSTSVSPKTQHPHYFQSSPASALPSSLTGPYVDERQRPASIPISSASGQNVYQMYTLHTSAGAVPIPVDVQAASRVADEKRKRNAGASARFRARRKEKEKESTVTIDKLEEQVKHLSEQVEFYRRERGALANALMQYPGGDRHFPRPPSPRYRAVSITGPSRRASDDYSQDMSPGPADRNVRRRTSTQSLPMGAPPAPQYATQSQHYDHYHRQHPPLPGPAALLPPIHAQMTQPVSPHAHQAPPPSQSLQHASGWHSYNTGSRPNTQQGRPSDPHGR